MSGFEKSLTIMEKLFGKDYQFALATAKDNIPSVRFTDTYYKDKAFYIVTYRTSRKVEEIEANREVSLCSKMYRFYGEAYNIGHPLKEENKEIRDILIEAFKPWYFAHNNEQDENMCYLKIDLKNGFFYKDGMGYQVDFEAEKAETFPFEFDIVTLD